MGESIELQWSATRLLLWFDENKRDLPWRINRNAWFTLLSEVMLQQTRVDQVIPYFEKFVRRFPTLKDFALAELDEILWMWEGLGYYSRARNLQNTCKQILLEWDGIIPSDYQTLLQIKGIGPYTAAAISSQVYNIPHATVDGNIIRVLTRFTGIQDDVTKASTKKRIQQVADSFLIKSEPGKTNEALMELGATICKPKKPTCESCPIQLHCIAAQTLQTDSIPYKKSKPKVPHHHIGIGIIFNAQGEILIAKRPDDKMLGGLWEFPGGKQELEESIESTIKREFDEEIGIQIQLDYPLKPLKHAYSHFKITLHCWVGKWLTGEPKPLASKELRWIMPNELGSYAFPKANRKLIEQFLNRYE